MVERRNIMKKRKKYDWFDFVNGAFMLFLVITFLYPMLHIVARSFSDTSSIMQNKVTIFPRGFNLKAYDLVIKNPRIPRAYFNSIIYTAVGTTFNLGMTAVAAYPLSKKNFFGRKFFINMILITMFFNGGMIPNYLIVKSFGLIDSMWALIIPNAIWTIQLLIVKSFYESLPAELEESAIIDGASQYIILFRIIIPLSKAALASIALMYFMGHWNSFFNPMIYFTSMEKFPLQVVLRDMLIDDTIKESNLVENANLTPEALKSATIVLTMIPVMIVYPFAQKYFAKGIMLGSVKG